MSDYHRFVPPIGKARYFGLTHRQVLESLPRERLERWKARLDLLRSEPFRGVTADGQLVPGLFTLRDEGAPTADILSGGCGFAWPANARAIEGRQTSHRFDCAAAMGE